MYITVLLSVMTSAEGIMLTTEHNIDSVSVTKLRTHERRVCLALHVLLQCRSLLTMLVPPLSV